jgi:3-deoxy-D-manno-octulosonic-acid transferase
MASSLASRLALVVYMTLFNLLLPLPVMPLLPFLLLIRKRRKTLFRRLGFQCYPGDNQSTSKPVWIHALSVGELLSCIPLLKELREQLPARSLVLSVSTLAAYEIASEKACAHVNGLFYFPYDLLPAVRKCLTKIRPALFLLIETDIWPGFLMETRRRGIPCFLLNGRLSSRSLQFSRLFSALFTPAFRTFARIYPQSEEEATRFLSLGVEGHKICHAGNLKFDLRDSLPSPEMIAELRRSLGVGEKDFVLLAGSTHPGEEAMLRSTFLTLRQLYAELKLIIVPRHPERADGIERIFANDPLLVALFSRGPHPEAEVTVVDCMGLLSSLYALADLAFVGGSLVKKGGQNPIEPAAAGKPVLFGPDMSDFPDVSRLLLETGGAIQVHNSSELTEQCARLLADPGLARAMGIRASSAVHEHQGTSQRIAAEIASFLKTIETDTDTQR